MLKYKLLVVLSVISCSYAIAMDNNPVLNLVRRVSGNPNVSLSYKIKDAKDGRTYYKYAVDNGELKIVGSDKISICRGFYDYVKNNGMGMYTWSGNNISVPSSLPSVSPVHVISPFENHYYLNVVTYGYSMPFWDWKRWEQEIDWMALHGINMPLTLVAHEAIMARVYKKFGLSDEEINSYFVGPAHLPFSRMGLMEKLDGPLNSDWYNDQIELQHKILDRMRSLDMKPICPSFAGFVPEGIKRIYPDVRIVKTHWGGAFNNWMINPEEKLFSEMMTSFIEEWEKEFGKCEYYLSDSFNEMEIPFPDKGDPARYSLLASYGEKVYSSIKRANKDAVWVMQGWMFGYQRHIWDYETLGALVSRVPDDKMLLLDLAVDYNKHFWHSEVNWEYYKGFYNKQWVYSVIPNMGGKTGMTGVLDFYANGHLEALSSSNRGNLVAHGLAPEGIENNEVLYELVTDAGWSDHRMDVRDWLKQYSINRYGKAPAQLMKAWDYLLKSVYGTFTDHPRFNWQFRPGTVKNGSIYMNEDYFRGLEAFLSASGELKDSPYYLTDLCEMTAHYLGGKAEILTRQIDQEYLLGDTLQAHFLQSRFETFMLGMDRILSQHPTLRLDRWLSFASASGKTASQSNQYETNARRIVTIWGPPVDDYSARIWSGLVGSYYHGRWKEYYKGRDSGKSADLSSWERKWVEENRVYKKWNSDFDLIDFSRKLLSLSQDMSSADFQLHRPAMIGTWSLVRNSSKDLLFNIPARMLVGLNGVSLECLKGKGDIEVTGLVLEADGKVIYSSSDRVLSDEGILNLKLEIPANVTANNGCVLKLKIKSSTDSAAGIVICVNKKQS